MQKISQKYIKTIAKQALQEDLRPSGDITTRIIKNKKVTAKIIAVDMVKEKLISKKEAILRIDPSTLDTLLHPTLDEKVEKKVIAKGLPASPGGGKWKGSFHCR